MAERLHEGDDRDALVECVLVGLVERAAADAQVRHDEVLRRREGVVVVAQPRRRHHREDGLPDVEARRKVGDAHARRFKDGLELGFPQHTIRMFSACSERR